MDIPVVGGSGVRVSLIPAGRVWKCYNISKSCGGRGVPGMPGGVVGGPGAWTCAL